MLAAVTAAPDQWAAGVSDVVTIRDLLEVWLPEAKLSDRSDYTARARRGAASRITRTALGDVRMDRMDRPSLEAFVRGYDGAPSTLRADLIALRAAWRWGRERGLCPDKPLPKVTVRRGEPVLSRYTPTADEVAAVLALLRERRTRPPGWPWRAVYLLWATGCRSGEIAELTWDRVDLQRRRLHVRGKTGNRAVAIHPDVAAELGTWERHGDTIAGCQPASVRGHLHNYIFLACRELDIPRWSLNGLRRAAVGKLYRTGEDPAVAAALLGHSPQVALQHYRQVADEDLDAAVLRAGLGVLPSKDADVVDFEGARKGRR